MAATTSINHTYRIDYSRKHIFLSLKTIKLKEVNKNGFWMIFAALLFALLALIFYLYFGFIGIVFAIIFGLSAAIYLVAGIATLLFF